MDAYIGIGHGRKPSGVFDPGAVSGDLLEHTLAISVVDAYADAMRRSGVSVRDASNSGPGHDPNWEGSARRANRLRVKYADEVHFNAFDGTGTGVEVVVRPDTSAANRKACRAIAAGIARVLRIPVRHPGDGGLVFRTTQGFLNTTNMPAAIIEVAFLDNPADRRAILRKDALEQVGEVIAEARCAFLGVTARRRMAACEASLSPGIGRPLRGGELTSGRTPEGVLTCFTRSSTQGGARHGASASTPPSSWPRQPRRRGSAGSAA